MLFVVGLAFISSFVIVNRVPAPGMAVGNAICFIVTGQVVVAVLIDHFGLSGAAASAIDIRRCAGVTLMITGLLLARST